MLDYAITLAPELHQSMRQVRELEAERRSWLRRYRELKRSERRERPAQRELAVASAAGAPAVFKTWI